MSVTVDTLFLAKGDSIIRGRIGTVRAQFGCNIEASVLTQVPERVELGAAQYQLHLPLLRSIEADFGVAPEVMVAIWGIETSYGNYVGSHDVIQALVETGFEERGTDRGDWLRRELISALLILDKGYVNLPDFQGSYAGAMGQCQFMPSNYFSYGAFLMASVLSISSKWLNI